MEGDELLIIIEPIVAFAILAAAFAGLFLLTRRLRDKTRRLVRAGLYAVAVAGLLAFGLWVWPTPWRYWATRDLDYRTDRRTGQIEVGTSSGDWTPVTGQTEADIRRSASEFYQDGR